MPEEGFKYFDGFDDVWGDPFEIDYKFDRAIMERNEDIDLLDQWVTEVPHDESGNPDTKRFTKDQERLYLDACRRYIPLIQSALELRPFDRKTGQGLQSIDVLHLWSTYINWKLGVKKNTESPPGSTTPTDSDPNSTRPSTGPSSPMGASPENPSMDSIKT